MNWVNTLNWGDVPGWIQVALPVLAATGGVLIWFRKTVAAGLAKFRQGRAQSADRRFIEQYRRLIATGSSSAAIPESVTAVAPPPLRTNFSFTCFAFSKIGTQIMSQASMSNRGNNDATNVTLDFDSPVFEVIGPSAWPLVEANSDTVLRFQVNYPDHVPISGAINWLQENVPYSQRFELLDGFEEYREGPNKTGSI